MTTGGGILHASDTQPVQASFSHSRPTSMKGNAGGSVKQRDFFYGVMKRQKEDDNMKNNNNNQTHHFDVAHYLRKKINLLI